MSSADQLTGGAGQDVRAFSRHMETMSDRLARIIEAFEWADTAEAMGRPGLAAAMVQLLEVGYDPSAFPEFFKTQQIPPWVDPEAWEALPEGERARRWSFLEAEFARFMAEEARAPTANPGDLAVRAQGNDIGFTAAWSPLGRYITYLRKTLLDDIWIVDMETP